ncbi:hypothetical protein SCALM49S_01688 [Streptomyces californicus]
MHRCPEPAATASGVRRERRGGADLRAHRLEGPRRHGPQAGAERRQGGEPPDRRRARSRARARRRRRGRRPGAGTGPAAAPVPHGPHRGDPAGRAEPGSRRQIRPAPEAVRRVASLRAGRSSGDGGAARRQRRRRPRVGRGWRRGRGGGGRSGEVRVGRRRRQRRAGAGRPRRRPGTAKNRPLTPGASRSPADGSQCARRVRCPVAGTARGPQRCGQPASAHAPASAHGVQHGSAPVNEPELDPVDREPRSVSGRAAAEPVEQTAGAAQGRHAPVGECQIAGRPATGAVRGAAEPRRQPRAEPVTACRAPAARPRHRSSAQVRQPAPAAVRPPRWTPPATRPPSDGPQGGAGPGAGERVPVAGAAS